MIKNILWAGLHHGLGRGAFFVFFLALPRLMGLEEVGRFTFWYTVFLILCQPPLDFALTMVVVKYTARGDLGIVRRTMNFALWFVPVFLGGLWAVSTALPSPHRLIGALVIYLGLSLSLNLVFGYFRGLEQLEVEGIVGGLQKVLGLALLFGLYALGLTGWRLPALALIGMGAFGWILIFGLYSGRLAGLRSAIATSAASARSVISIWKEGLALGAVGLVGLLYLRVDVMMLGVMVGPEEVGLYFTASKFLEAAYVIPHIVMLVFFPRLVRSEKQSPVLKRMTLVLASCSLVAFVVVLITARWGIGLLYDPSLSRVSSLLFALAPTVIPVYLGYLFTQALVAIDRQRSYLAVAVGGLILNLGLNAILIPSYQGHGAAIATVLTEIAITASAVFLIRRFAD